MTIKISFPQRQLLDKLIAAGKKGLIVNLNSPTAVALVRGGYAEWQELSGIRHLLVTTSGLRFYQRSPDRSPTSKSTESAAMSPGASSTIKET